MSSLLQGCRSRRIPLAAPPDDEMSAQVYRLLAGIYPPAVISERRREQRFPFPRLLVLTPANAHGTRGLGRSVTAAGKHLSESGLSFFHPEPLAYRWVIASFERGDGHQIGFLLDVNWCRFTRQGWYESGGEFIRLVAPQAEDVMSRQLPVVSSSRTAGQPAAN